MRTLSRISTTLSLFVLLLFCGFSALAQEDEQNGAITPLRLSFVEGSVSFWRNGAEDWVEARRNMPLAVGDALYVGKRADLELQMGSRAFIRADDDTQLTLSNQTADYLQLKITSGRVSLDLRTLPSGYRLEVNTPNAMFIIEHPAYYRLDVNGDLHFITRRGGRATMILANGESMRIQPSEEIVVQGASARTYVAPELDNWDRWNYDRTNQQLDAVSERYLPSGIAGASELDHYGRWRVVSEYGPVWVPDAVPPGWVPYSTGRWIWDPYYQWTWIDDAPWGWAPFHYGRWVYLSGYWAWTPGPVVVMRQPVYSPALVAFFGVSSHVSVGISIGGTGLGWVALSWGEPLIPWWGRPSFVGRPWWGGWHGPRVVNNVVIKQTNIINVTNISYHNTRVPQAVVTTRAEHFGRGKVHDTPVRITEARELKHLRGALPVKASPASLVAGAPKSIRPPEPMLSHPVVATRAPRETKLPWRIESKPDVKIAPEPHYVPAPKPTAKELPRPEFGQQGGEERVRPPLPPRYEERRRETAPVTPPSVVRQRDEPDRAETKQPRITPPSAPTTPRVTQESTPQRTEKERVQESHEIKKGAATPTAPQEMRQRDRIENVERERADLPGKPANRVYRKNDQDKQDKGDRRRSQ